VYFIVIYARDMQSTHLTHANLNCVMIRTSPTVTDGRCLM